MHLEIGARRGFVGPLASLGIAGAGVSSCEVCELDGLSDMGLNSTMIVTLWPSDTLQPCFVLQSLEVSVHFVEVVRVCSLCRFYLFF